VRVLLVTHYYSTHRGGIELVAGTIARLLAPRYSIVWAASDCDPIPQEPRIDFLPMRANNFVERSMGVPFPLWGPLSLVRLWTEIGRADAVHIHDFVYSGSLAAFMFAAARCKPVMITQHVGFIPYRSALLRFVLGGVHATMGRLILSRSRQVIFISHVVQSYYEGFVRFRRPSVVISNGVDDSLFPLSSSAEREEARQRLGFGASEPVFLFVGRFVEKKGLSILKELTKRLPDVSWVFAGWGPQDPGDWDAPNVKVFKYVKQSELANLYQSADLLVLPSFGEGLPLVVQEAMSCGTPAIVGLDTAAAIDAPNGLLLARRVSGLESVDEWESALRDAAKDLSALRSIRVEVAAFARSRWSWSVCAARYANILEQL
jgi:glycosyltransferase involved in cell wall biosynthesis